MTRLVLWLSPALVVVCLLCLALDALLVILSRPYSRGTITFVSNREGSRKIYLMDIDRGRTLGLTHHAAVERRPAWSPDGRWLTFYSNRSGSWDIHITRPALRDLSRPLVTSATRDGNPAWSPDGRWLAFDSTRTGNLEIFVMAMTCMDAPDTCAPMQLTHHAASDQYPAWSPDSEQIVFESLRYEQSDLLLMDRDGGNVRRLTANNYADWGASWSPDGTRIAYASGRSTADWDIFMLDPYCSEDVCDTDVRLLVAHPYADTYPAWSPDGRWLVFSAWVDRDYELFIVGADGQGLQRLTDNDSDDEQAVWWP